MESFMKRLFALISCAFLISCVDAKSNFTPVPLDYTARGPINVNVGEVKVVSNYKSPFARPNVEHEFPTPPEAAIKQWVKQRVYAVGTQGVLEITIDDASVKEVPLKKTKGVKGVFTTDQDARYDATMKVSMKLFNGTDPMSVAMADVLITRSKSISEKATVEDRERLYDGMTRDMMETFDAQMSQRFKSYFNNYLR